jgi:hypothetical protein
MGTAEEVDGDVAAGEASEPVTEGATGPASPERGASARDARRWSAQVRPGWASSREDFAESIDRTWTRSDGGLPGDGRPRDSTGSLGAIGRELLGAPSDDPIRRLGLALVAWPPIGLAAAAAIGDITGCATYSVECAGSDTLLPWLAQAAILGLLLLLPPLARVLVGGTIAAAASLLAAGLVEVRVGMSLPAPLAVPVGLAVAYEQEGRHETD